MSNSIHQLATDPFGELELRGWVDPNDPGETAEVTRRNSEEAARVTSAVIEEAMA